MRTLTCDSRWSVALRGHLATRPSTPEPTPGALLRPRSSLHALAIAIAGPVTLAVYLVAWGLS